MKTVTSGDLQRLYVPPRVSHKGNNGRLLIIGGSHLFHAASIWSLTVASRLVDLVHYASVPENNELILRMKEEFRNGIVIHRRDAESYILEDDCILIGPGMVRPDNEAAVLAAADIDDISLIDQLGEESSQTVALTHILLKRFPQKQWVLDAGALQVLTVTDIPERAILTPHHGEFEGLWKKHVHNEPHDSEITTLPEQVKTFALRYRCIVLVKGMVDYASEGQEIWEIPGGNAGMTKGGTGDVLAGLISGLACKNDPLLATLCGSFINKQSGDDLYKTVGPGFNATDLANQIPVTMHHLLNTLP